MADSTTASGNIVPISAMDLLERYRSVRAFTEDLCQPLAPEDCVIQSMPDVSPTRWHLAHTTWFFETFVLVRATSGYEPWDPRFEYLFNSYYNSVGRQFPRAQRGLLSRPTVHETWEYRRHVDQRMEELLQRVLVDQRQCGDLLQVIELGLHHEQQHQELMLTDIKHVLWQNPLYPVYRESDGHNRSAGRPLGLGGWIDFDEGLIEFGNAGGEFAFDNETPRHRQFIEAFQLAGSLATVGEYLEFIDDGGYEHPGLWLSAGWQAVCANGWHAPLYWIHEDGDWRYFTLAGLRDLVDDEPVCHISYYEADAYARWRGCRLPTEFEWELAAQMVPVEGNFVDDGRPHPAPAKNEIVAGRPDQLFGDVWEWTASPYSPYPRYRTVEGALGEYNGKFMSGQYVLRGGSCASSQSHIRPTYRNFFPPDARWQFSGLRLARSDES